MIVILPEEEANRRLLFSYNLKYMMQDKGFTRTSLAGVLGKSRTVIDSYLQCSEYPDDNMIYMIAGALGCKVDDLLDNSHIPWNMGKSEN